MQSFFGSRKALLEQQKNTGLEVEPLYKLAELKLPEKIQQDDEAAITNDFLYMRDILTRFPLPPAEKQSKEEAEALTPREVLENCIALMNAISAPVPTAEQREEPTAARGKAPAPG